jgi:hypothetical protein
MELIHNEIPLEFIRRLPEGVKLVVRHGREFLVVERVESRSGTSLIAEQVHIHGEPSIRLGTRIGDADGLLFVDAYWGSHAKLYSFIPNLETGEQFVDAYVPGSKESLMVDYACDVDGCGSKRGIELVLPGGENRVLVCARLGCPGHRLELANLPKPVQDSLSGINFFGAGSLDDGWFDSV